MMPHNVGYSAYYVYGSIRSWQAFSCTCTFSTPVAGNPVANGENKWLLHLAGTTFALDSLGLWTVVGSYMNMSECLAECTPGSCCFATLQYYGTTVDGTCKLMELDPAAPSSTSGYQLYYKLVPSDAISAFSTNVTTAKAVAAYTTYQGCSTVDWESLLSGNSNNIGTAVEGHEVIKTSVTPAQCQGYCTKASACFGFLYTPTSGGKCLLISGETIENVRSFFTVPDATIPVCEPGTYR